MLNMLKVMQRETLTYGVTGYPKMFIVPFWENVNGNGYMSILNPASYAVAAALHSILIVGISKCYRNAAVFIPRAG